MFKEVKIKNISFNALFNTGSKCNVVTEYVHNLLNKTTLSDSNFYLRFWFCEKDKNKTKPFGHFEQKVIIDNELFNVNMHPQIAWMFM